MPIVRISRAIADLECGDTLEVIADDPAFPSDVTAWAKKTGHGLLSLEEADPARAVIRKQ